MLEVLVSPQLSNSDKDYIRGWDEKVDAMLAIGVFFPDTLNEINSQVKGVTDGKFDIYDVDKMMHKLLGKKDKSVDTGFDFDLFN